MLFLLTGFPVPGADLGLFNGSKSNPSQRREKDEACLVLRRAKVGLF